MKKDFTVYTWPTIIPKFWKKRMTKSYSGLEKENSKPRRGSFLNYFWKISIHAVCFCNCYFNFNLRNPWKAYTQYQHHRKKNNRKILQSVDQPLADLDLEKQQGKEIQWRAGAKNKLLEKGMETPSSLVIDLLTTISNCYYCRKIHKEGCQSSLWQQKLLVLSHVPPNQYLSIWSISTNLSYFFCLLWSTGLVVFNWNLLHNLFHFENRMQHIHVHFVLLILLYAGIGFWSLNKLWKNGEISHELILPASTRGVDPQNSEKGGWDTYPLAGYIETFYCSENSIKIIQNNFKEKRPPLAHP